MDEAHDEDCPACLGALSAHDDRPAESAVAAGLFLMAAVAGCVPLTVRAVVNRRRRPRRGPGS